MIAAETINNKVLWVCRENIGRSQVAEALWERKATNIHAASAGILVDIHGQTLAERPEAELVIQVMDEEYGVDMRNRRRTSLDVYSPADLGQAALIMVMAEASVVPDELVAMSNSELWAMPDLKDRNHADTIAIIRDIESVVTGLQEASRHL